MGRKCRCRQPLTPAIDTAAIAAATIATAIAAVTIATAIAAATSRLVATSRLLLSPFRVSSAGAVCVPGMMAHVAHVAPALSSAMRRPRAETCMLHS
jgi:hypothetical protein